ncbi:hypothetical protein EJB05_42816, partial [Eragrostis curvula]
MAPPGQEAEAEHEGQGGAQDEEDAQHEQLVGMMASLGLGLGEAESAAAAVARFRADEVAAEPERRFWKDAAAAAMRLWDEDAAAVDYFVPAAPCTASWTRTRTRRRRRRLPAAGGRGSGDRSGGDSAPRCAALRRSHPPRPGCWAPERALRRRCPCRRPRAHGAAAAAAHAWRRAAHCEPPYERRAASFRARAGGALSAVPRITTRRSSRTPAGSWRAGMGTGCSASSLGIATRSLGNGSSLMSDEVVFMIESCGTQRSKLLLREAMMSWMTPNQMYAMESNRLRVVEAFIKESPREITRFIFDAVARNCTRLACQPNGLNLLQKCLYFVNRKEKDDMFIQISYRSLQLSQNSSGNYIVQEVLKNGDPLHLATIASCLRTNYVELSRQKYSSNVVEQCLRVFDEGEKFVIVNELVCYPHFRDLVTDEFANFVISTALQTCNVQLQDILASTILDQNVNHRNQHCLKIFGLLSKLGYLQ